MLWVGGGKLGGILRLFMFKDVSLFVYWLKLIIMIIEYVEIWFYRLREIIEEVKVIVGLIY